MCPLTVFPRWQPCALVAGVLALWPIPDAAPAGSPVFPGKTWLTKTPAQAGMDAKKLAAFRDLVGGRGCVVRGGHMVYSWGDAAKRADVASACKPWFIHFLLLLLEQGGITSLDEPIRAWEPRLDNLNAGLQFKDKTITWRHLANQISCYGVQEAPGQAYDYSDYNMALLADTLFLKAYKSSYAKMDAEILHPKLTELIGCQDKPTLLAFGTKDRPGRVGVSVRDFCRFGLLYLHKGNWNGKQLISAKHATMAVASPVPNSVPRTQGKKAQMIAGQRSIGGGNNQTDHLGSYSFAWWINGVDRDGKRHWPDAPLDTYGAFGHGGIRAMVVIPSLDIVVSWNDAKIKGRERENQVLKALVNAAGKKPINKRYPLSYPPKLPDGKVVVTEETAAYLKPGPNLRRGVVIAKTPPRVDFAYYPEQNYPGNPWSHRSDGIVVGDKYYSSSNDHLAPKGTAHLWEYDADAKKFRLLCDTTKFLESVKAFPPDMNYRPGEMQSRIDLGSDGWLYYATDRGSPTATHDGNGYKGEWILRTHPKTRETRIVATFPIPKHTIPATVLDPKRMILYGGTAVGRDAPNQKIQFFALDVKTGKLLKVADDGPYRTLIFASSTGKVYWQGKGYDPATNRVFASKVPDVRSATKETARGIVYGTSGRSADIWAFNVKTEEFTQIGSGAVAKQEYVASIEVDPTGRYLYYVPGAHGGAAGDGTPIVQYDLKTGTRKALAFLHQHFWDKYGYALDGSFGSALDEKGERLFISWDGWRRGQPRGWESAAITVVHIPASERQP